MALIAEPTNSEAPRCRMCVRPARWLVGQAVFAMYCAGRSCSNRDRICQACERPFLMNAGGAGTRYCSPACKTAGYHPVPVAANCAWCESPAPPGTRRGVRSAAWPYICTGCLYPLRRVLDRLKAHRVPPERARQLLAEPYCEVCGTDVLTPVRNSARKVAPLLVVDHDHTCCPADAHSCGLCVRGLLCQACNAAAGQLYDSPKAARSLAEYLERWQSQ